MSSDPRTAAPWPTVEATALLAHVEGRVDPAAPVLFETGYGPSGLPHIGTFAEVARTTFVRRAFEGLSGRRTHLVAFSDDMDGLRKIPLNVPDRERLLPHVGKPLSSIPDPFGTDASWSAHMNRRLREFLDRFGFDYEFRSSTEQYRSGVFDRGLRVLIERVDAILDIIRPTLRPENREFWSPFMVTCPSCGRNLTTTVLAYHRAEAEVDFACDGGRSGDGIDGCGYTGRTSILGGLAKVGWKVDWALRWWTFGVHYEMYGKDLIESATLSCRIVLAMGGVPPLGYFYEMFLDEEGKKISKSVGKGISVDTWQQYAPVGALLAFLYQNPKQARRLHWDVIPQCTDHYLKQLSDWEGQDELQRRWNPSWFYFGGQRPTWKVDIDYSLARNVAVCLGTGDEGAMTAYLTRYDARVSDADHSPLVSEIVKGALAYDRDFEAGRRTLSRPPAEVVPALLALAGALETAGAAGVTGAAEVQGLAYEAARTTGVEPKALFLSIYRGLIGQDRGPRLGSFALTLGLADLARRLRALTE